MYCTTKVYPGIACFVRGPVKHFEPYTYMAHTEDGEEIEVPCDDGDGEWIDGDGSRLRLVMVGDDREFVVDADEIEPLAEDDFCSDCGQIGCGHGRYSEE
jgi:hypothetical protein